MPYLSEISYSRQGCIDAIRDYYEFLIQLHLPSSCIEEPPAGGWPDITVENMRPFGKSDEVVMLLRELPYIRDAHELEVAPDIKFLNYHEQVEEPWLIPEEDPRSNLRLLSEGLICLDDEWVDIPAHVVCLTRFKTASPDPDFMLDTQLGVIYWCTAPEVMWGSWREGPSGCYPEPVLDHPEDYAASEKDLTWRECRAWAVPDFFEMLKDQFRKLNHFPIGINMAERAVHSVYDANYRQPQVDRDGVRAVFREHGWPDLARYRKEECLKAVTELVALSI